MGDEPTPTPGAPEALADSPTPPEPKGAEPKTFDEDYVKRLRSEAASWRTQAQEAKTKVEEYETANASEVEKQAKRADKAEQRATEAEAKLLRFEVAQEKNVPAKLVPLLTGKTREELEAQAALILENAKPVDPDFDGGPRDPAPVAKTPEQQHNELVTALFGAGPAAVGLTSQ